MLPRQACSVTAALKVGIIIENTGAVMTCVTLAAGHLFVPHVAAASI
ncbi:hypothetical protein MAHJHV49_14730 [Mycobacterium avium subsp. hominissuis]